MFIFDANIIFITILFDTIDTQIIDGTYYGIPCIIKRISNNDSFGIKPKTLREISALKKNKHQNIIKIYDIKYDTCHVYLILEKGDKNLLDLTKGEMTNENIIEDITLGLKTLHANDYIHGDLSLKNVVRFSNGGKNIYKLIDFGSSTKVYRKSAICEPTMYISPIEMLSKPEYPNSHIGILHEYPNSHIGILPDKLDSWALGCVAYYVTTGTILFIEENKEKILSQIFNRLGIGNINNNNSNRLSIGKFLKNHSSNDKIIKSIKKLLNVDSRKRYSIADFYSKIFDKNNIASKLEIINDFEIFKPDSINCSNINRSKLMHIFLFFNIQYGIPIENIFLTFKLLHKLSLSDDHYIFNGILLYSLTTKLVSHVQISLQDIATLVNSNCNIKVKNINELNDKIYLLLESLNWDIDEYTSMSYISDVSPEHKMKYLIISLIMLCDVKYDVLSGSFGYKIITVLLQCLNNTNTVTVHVENKYQMLHVINDIIISLHSMKENDLIQGKIIKAYFKLIGIDNFSEWVSKINIHKIINVFDSF